MKPIIFSAPMARRIADGKKTQTRRVIKTETSEPKGVPPLHLEPYMWDGEQEIHESGVPMWIGTHPDYPYEGKWFTPKYWIDDRLWVREPWIEWDECEYRYQAEALTDPPPWWVATATKHQRWKNSMYMPRNAARLFLDVIAVRPERLLDITEADAQAEGFSDRAEFLSFWDTLYAKKPQLQAAKNPWVWVYGFRQI